MNIQLDEESMLNMSRSNLLEFIATYGYKEGDFTLSSGKKSDFYINMKNVTWHFDGFHEVGRNLFNMITTHFQNPKPTAIGGLEKGSDPIALAVGARMREIPHQTINMFSVRKEPKGHGARQFIDGYIKNKDQVLIIEDVTTTGESALKAIENIKKEMALRTEELKAEDPNTERTISCNIIGVLSIVDHGEGARELFTSKGIKFMSLFTLDDIRQYRKRAGITSNINIE